MNQRRRGVSTKYQATKRKFFSLSRGAFAMHMNGTMSSFCMGSGMVMRQGFGVSLLLARFFRFSLRLISRGSCRRAPCAPCISFRGPMSTRQVRMKREISQKKRAFSQRCFSLLQRDTASPWSEPFAWPFSTRFARFKSEKRKF